MTDQPQDDPLIDVDQLNGWDYELRRAGIERHAGDRAAAVSAYRHLVEHLRLRSELSEHDRELYEIAVSHLSIDELTHPDVVTIARIHKRPLTNADSLFRSLIVRRRKKQLGVVPEKYIGIGKANDQLFAESMGIRKPETLFIGTFDAIPIDLRTDVVLKPMSSSDSIGAYYLFDESNIYSIQHSRRVASWEALSDAVVAQFGERSLETMVFQIQELVYEDETHPARDLKFYTFYGRIGLILEASRYPSRQYAYFNEDLTPAACGRNHEPRFTDPSMTIVDKGGLSAEKLEMVTWMSEQIPVPFMRIDFLNTEAELVFVEFSSAPGMSHTWNDDYDRLLGRYYNEAEMRLVNDLLAGKQFEGFREFIRRLDASQTSDAS